MNTVPLTGSTARVGKLLSRKLLFGRVAGSGITVATAIGAEKPVPPFVDFDIMIWLEVVSSHVTWRMPLGPTYGTLPCISSAGILLIVVGLEKVAPPSEDSEKRITPGLVLTNPVQLR